MIYEQLKKDNIQALKNHDNVLRGILSVILNKIKILEVEKRSKNEELLDSDIIAIIIKSIKELEEEKEGYQQVNNIDKVNDVERQINYVKQYLPKMLSYDEILSEIEKLDDKSIPNVMKYFKNNFLGKVDMSLVNKAIKEFQNK